MEKRNIKTKLKLRCLPNHRTQKNNLTPILEISSRISLKLYEIVIPYIRYFGCMYAKYMQPHSSNQNSIWQSEI